MRPSTGRSICVTGSIKAAEVETGGDLLVAEGIAADGRGRIRIAGPVQAKYVSGADIEAKAGLQAVRAIVDSRVRCQGRSP